MGVGIWLAAAWVAIGSTASAQEYRPSFHPDQLKGPPAGALNEVLVLGSPHLSGLPDSFRSEQLEPLLERLEAWRPTAVAIENLSGLQCDAMRRYPSRYAESVETYCYDPSAEGRALGLDVPAAYAEVERLLAAWPEAPTAAERRRLAALLLAAGEPTSALVQWLRLPEGERKAQGKAIMAAWDNPYVQERKAMDQPLFENLAQSDGLLNIYRAYNTPETQMLAYRSDFGATHVEPSPEAFGRRYLGYWETRNLRMVANIRDVLGRYPGTRMLTIVGASHKGYYEAYLNQMHDVRLVSSDAVLR
nr:DUF5694 domain-containing protein [Brevundimonas diminuta]